MYIQQEPNRYCKQTARQQQDGTAPMIYINTHLCH